MPSTQTQSYIGRVPKSAFIAFAMGAFCITLVMVDPRFSTVGAAGGLAIVLGFRELQKARIEIDGDKVSITGRATFGAFGKPTVVLSRRDITRVENSGVDLRVYYQRAGKEKKIDYLTLNEQQQAEIYQLLTTR